MLKTMIPDQEVEAQAEKPLAAKPKSWWKTGCCCLAMPIVLVAAWLFVQWGYEQTELWLLSRKVDESAIPAEIISRDARNDWPYGTSNGAFVRITWLLGTENKTELINFASNLAKDLADDDIEVEIHDLGLIPESIEPEVTGIDDKWMFLLRISYGRSNLPWEWSD